jgi:hypothetical protein
MNETGWSVRQLVMGLVLVALAACAHRSPEPFVKDELVQVTATVEAVDLPARLVSLRGPNGPATIRVGPQVSNLENVQVGDEVVVSYYEAIAAEMKKPGGVNEGFRSATAAATAQPGALPASAVRQTITTTVKIESVDTSLNTVTFLRQDGFVRTLAVKSPGGRTFIRGLSPGDEVDVTYTEAVAVEVVATR